LRHQASEIDPWRCFQRAQHGGGRVRRAASQRMYCCARAGVAGGGGRIEPSHRLSGIGARERARHAPSFNCAAVDPARAVFTSAGSRLRRTSSCRGRASAMVRAARPDGPSDVVRQVPQPGVGVEREALDPEQIASADFVPRLEVTLPGAGEQLDVLSPHVVVLFYRPACDGRNGNS
jgi:hypothetical protein